MRIFVAGASGAVGRRLIPLLAGRGHEVTGTTRSPERTHAIRALGAEPVVVDALDGDAVMAAVTEAKPQVVVHELTAISGPLNLRKFDAYFAATNRLRTEGTDHLLTAAHAAGVRRFIAQSYTGWPNERTGGPVKNEQDPIDPHPTPASQQTIAALRYLETAVTSASPIQGIVLRYGGFYGPGTDLGPGGQMLETVRKRQLPVLGGGTGIFSFLHIEDAAQATVLAIEDGAPGIYNIVDDEPAAVRDWLPYLARVIGAKPPLRLPAWLVRPMLGEHGV